MRFFSFALIVLLLFLRYETEAHRRKSQGARSHIKTKSRHGTRKNNPAIVWATYPPEDDKKENTDEDLTIHNISIIIIQTDENCKGNGVGNGGCLTPLPTILTSTDTTDTTETTDRITDPSIASTTEATTITDIDTTIPISTTTSPTTTTILTTIPTTTATTAIPSTTITIPKPTLSPIEICNLPTDKLQSIPDESLTESIRNFCSSEVDGKNNVVKHRIMPETTKMKLQFRCGDFKYEVAMDDAKRILELQEYNPIKKFVIFVTGLADSPTDTTAIDTMAQAFHNRDEHNFVVLDIAQFVDSLYTWAALDTDGVGELLAKALHKLSENVSIRKFHLIGHSLGAHIVGCAGYVFQMLTGKYIPRITGLDPSKACFSEMDDQFHRLVADDAAYVDIVHSNPSVLGDSNPTGTVDVYMNGLNVLSAFCQTTLCSHAEAWKIFAETIDPKKQFTHFLANECVSISDLGEGKCQGPEAYMGFAVLALTDGTYLYKKPSSAAPHEGFENFRIKKQQTRHKPKKSARNR